MTKVGKVQTVNMETGEVISEKANAFTMLPPAGDVCQECAVGHAWKDPHNQQSLHYQYHFHARHGRWPTWSDAMAHCDAETRALWRQELVAMMRQHDMPIPADLLAEEGGIGR